MNKIEWVTKDVREFMSRGYLSPGQSVEERIKEIGKSCYDILERRGDGPWSQVWVEFFLDYLSRGFYSLSSPVWSNFGKDKGFPIACNGTYAGDSVKSILEAACEVGNQSSKGAGTSIYIGDIRPSGSAISSGGISDGPLNFCRIYDTVTDVISQGSTRRGACAVYIDIDHPDIMEFFDIRTERSPIQHLSWGVCISDEFIDSIDKGTASPKRKETWLRMIKSRIETGYPYLFFTDTVNRLSPFEETIHASNLCSEICLPSSEDFSFVCCLASMNMDRYDEWKHSEFAVPILVDFLNLVLYDYMRKAGTHPSGFRRERKFIEKFGAIGVGILGWHSYLQSRSIGFESEKAERKAETIQKLIFEKARERSETYMSSEYLRKSFGMEELALLSREKEKAGRMNLALTAIAPTTSSSFILGGVSPSVEPLTSNYFVKDLQKGQYTWRNPYLEQLLESKGKNSPIVWRSILMNGGSVQHLSFLDREEKEVFRTFSEMSPVRILEIARARQNYLDQSQSLNLMFPYDTPGKEVHEALMKAWKLGLKTLYYHKSTSPSQELAMDFLRTSAEECELCAS